MLFTWPNISFFLFTNHPDLWVLEILYLTFLCQCFSLTLPSHSSLCSHSTLLSTATAITKRWCDYLLKSASPMAVKVLSTGTTCPPSIGLPSAKPQMSITSSRGSNYDPRSANEEMEAKTQAPRMYGENRKGRKRSGFGEKMCCYHQD